jgi:hypothetical protein
VTRVLGVIDLNAFPASNFSIMPYCNPRANDEVQNLKPNTTKPAVGMIDKNRPIVESPAPMDLVESPEAMDLEERLQESSQDVRAVL